MRQMKKTLWMLGLVLAMTLMVAGCKDKTTTEAVYEVESESSSQVETSQDEASQEAGESTSSANTDQEVDANGTVYPYVIVDKFGENIQIEAEPNSIISMSPEMTEIIFALGRGDRLIGRSSYCDYPAETADIPDFGTLFDLNIESIVAAQPDVIFLSSMASEENKVMLQDQGLTVVILDRDSSLAGTYDYMKLVAELMNQKEAGEAMVAEVQKEIQSVEEAVAGLEKPSVYYVVYAGDGYDSTATGDTFIHGIIEAAGGDNVAKDGEFWSYSVEKLVEQDPYMMFCSSLYETKARIEGLEGYKELTAVKEGRLFEVDENIFSRQGPRIGEAVRTLALLMHPEAFN